MLPLLCFAYNSTYSPNVEQTPFYLMLGREPPSIADMLMFIPEAQTPFGEKERKAMKAVLSATYEYILLKQQQKTPHGGNQYDMHAFKPGDEVLFYDSVTPAGLRPKLTRHWTGPYIVVRKTGPLSYVVASKDGLKCYRTHRDHLKSLRKRPVYLQSVNEQWKQQPSSLLKPIRNTVQQRNKGSVIPCNIVKQQVLRSTTPYL